MSEPAVGLDLGTSFATVAYCGRDGWTRSVRADDGAGPMPAVVFLDKTGAVAGEEALRLGEFDPLRVARHFKRDMGERSYRRTVRGETFPAAVVAALVLRQSKGEAERHLGSFNKAVVTVPAGFDEPARHATAHAARLAGIDLLELLPDPLAAAIAFDHQRRARGAAVGDGTVLVCDLGGGTFDASVIRVDGNAYRVIATAGDGYLGGIDFDRAIVTHVSTCIASQFGGYDPRDDEAAAEMLAQRAVGVKHALSDADEAAMHFRNRGNRIEYYLTRPEFEEAARPLIDRVREIVRRALAGVPADAEPKRLLLAGGGTRIPAVRAAIEAECGLRGERVPDDAVAHGAALHADRLLGGRAVPGLEATGVVPHGLALVGRDRASGGTLRVTLIERGTPLPVTIERTFPTTRLDQRRMRITLAECLGGDPRTGPLTTIGRGVVRDLPSALPARTSVRIAFEFSRDGRLSLRARLADRERELDTVLDRVTALSEEALERWSVRVANGLADESADAPPEGDVAESRDFDLSGHGTTDFDIDVLGLGLDLEDG